MTYPQDGCTKRSMDEHIACVLVSIAIDVWAHEPPVVAPRFDPRKKKASYDSWSFCKSNL